MENFILDLITEDQSGFIKDRKAQYNHLLFSVDTNRVFDLVSLTTFVQGEENMVFQPQCIKFN